jgi:hypothetical protein
MQSAGPRDEGFGAWSHGEGDMPFTFAPCNARSWASVCASAAGMCFGDERAHLTPPPRPVAIDNMTSMGIFLSDYTIIVPAAAYACMIHGAVRWSSDRLP